MIKNSISTGGHNTTIVGVISKWISMLLLTCIQFWIWIFCGRKANKSSYNSHHNTQICVFFFACLLCVCFTSSITSLLLSSDWVVFIAICDKDSTLLKSINKNRIPQCTFTGGFEVVGSKSRNKGCQFAADTCGSTKKQQRKEKKCTFYVGLLLFYYQQSCPIWFSCEVNNNLSF